MMAGCEVVSQEERQWVEDRWIALSQRMRIGPIDKCIEVTKEVWRRRDEHEKQPLQRRALVATASLRTSGMLRPPGSQRTGSSENSQDRVDGSFAWAQRRRRMTSDDIGQIDSHEPLQRPRGESRGGLNPMYTVKGKLHWVGVMFDWRWEGKLECVCSGMCIRLLMSFSATWISQHLCGSTLQGWTWK